LALGGGHPLNQLHGPRVIDAGVNYTGAMKLIEWMTSPEGQKRIAAFQIGGQQLFFQHARP